MARFSRYNTQSMSQALTRNFCIIAHIDHGKTTLTDRFLRLTEAVSERDMTERMMDSNPIEQERGITIKLAPVRMKYQYQGQEYILNLIDTPGHVDFGYEVSRSLAACEGAVLLIDATQGVQAQTLANYEKARELGLKVIPVLNKIDLPAAEVEQTSLEVMESFGMSEGEIVQVSAKTGRNVEQILAAVIDRIPPPAGSESAPPRALVFTSYFDSHKGIVAYVRVVDGSFGAQKLYLPQTETEFMPVELGVFAPKMTSVQTLATGQVGYVATGLKQAKLVRVGDTLITAECKSRYKYFDQDNQPVPTLFDQESSAQQTPVFSLPGYHEPTPMVFMSFFPVDGDDLALLTDALDKLSLHDSSLYFKATHSPALGNGFQVGFLGLLHAEIVKERLRREFNLELIATAPSVSYQITDTQDQLTVIKSAAEFPDPSAIKLIEEPITQASIFSPEKYVGAIIKLCQDHRGELIAIERIGIRSKLVYYLPLSEIITNFFDALKSASSGYASLEYQVVEYRPVDAVKLAIMVNREVVEALSSIVVRDKAVEIGRKLVDKLKEVIPRQMFEVPVQAAIGGQVVARADLKAYRKDVTAKLYGGDRTRRMKLLKKQAKGKKRMKDQGKVQLGADVFLEVLKQ